jgi:hypothetical protein
VLESVISIPAIQRMTLYLQSHLGYVITTYKVNNELHEFHKGVMKGQVSTDFPPVLLSDLV